MIAADAQQLFAEAVADVAPQRAEAPVPRHRRPRRSGGVRPADASQQRGEASPPFGERSSVVDLGLGDEAIEGLAQGIDRRWLRRLRRGELAVEARLDLHGASRQEAQTRLQQFVLESRRRALRCVLIVHGRGLHSPGGVPVLKEQLKTWLLQGPLAPCTMAFCSARASDGGAGAIYLLLRR
ncbi:MAG: Smr/MutS family protein [Proteobacteria bacterium]|nr:Smr/MutS family protein [Pseudomonadota bacterium]